MPATVPRTGGRWRLGRRAEIASAAEHEEERDAGDGVWYGERNVDDGRDNVASRERRMGQRVRPAARRPWPRAGGEQRRGETEWDGLEHLGQRRDVRAVAGLADDQAEKGQDDERQEQAAQEPGYQRHAGRSVPWRPTSGAGAPRRVRRFEARSEIADPLFPA